MDDNIFGQLKARVHTQGWGFPAGSVVKDPPASAGNTNLIPGLGRFPGDDNNNPLQDSFLGQRSLVGYCLRGHKGVEQNLGINQQQFIELEADEMEQ